MEINFHRTDIFMFGMRTQQTYSALILLNELLNENPDIKEVIELGTARGGLSIYFSLCLMERQGQIKTFDILTPENILFYKYFKRFDVSFYNKDVLKRETVNFIESIIKDKRVLLFCDGGNKPAEFNLYSHSLKPNDLIMAHDWGTEIKPEHLKEETLSILNPFHQEEFDQHKTLILSKIRK